MASLAAFGPINAFPDAIVLRRYDLTTRQRSTAPEGTRGFAHEQDAGSMIGTSVQ
jgi:hypothetical protein